MALAQVFVFRSLEPGDSDRMLRAVHGALVEVLRVPTDDPTVWLSEEPAACLHQPNRHGPGTTVVQVTMFAGRSLETKHRLHRELAARLEAAGVPRDDVVAVLVEAPTESWSTGGRPADQTELGFRIDI